MSRTLGNAVGESFEVRQVGPKVGGDLHVVLISMRESQLEGPKETGGPRDCRYHEAKFAEHPLPFIDANSPAVAKVLKDGEDAGFPSVSEFQCASVGVQDPA